MKKPHYVPLSLTTVMALVACAPPLANSWPEARPLGQTLETYHPPRQSPDQKEPSRADAWEAPRGVITLRQAMAAALLNNPELAEFGWEVRAAEARALQASLPSNPRLTVEVENIGGSDAFDSMETTVSLSQAILFGGKLDKRTRLAELDTELSGWDYETARIATLADVTQRFIAVLAAQQRVALARETFTLAEQVLSTIESRVDAGDISPVERTRARVPVATARIAVEQAERELTAARQRLAAMWGETTPEYDTAAGSLDDISPIPSAERLAALISQNPEIARWVVEMTQRRASLALARAEAVPDVEVGAGYRYLSEDSESVAVFEVSLPLPLFDRNQGGVLEAQYNLAKAREQRRAVEVRVRTALSVAYQRLANGHAEAIALRGQALPPATEAFDATREAFRHGALGFLDVLDAQRTLVEVRSQYLDSAAAYHHGAAEIEGLIGQSLSSLSADPLQESQNTESPEATSHEQ